MLQNHKGYIIRIRESRASKGMAVCLALNLLFQMIQPSMSLALTEGPSQPEVQSFEPVSTTQMVDPFTGDFNYNIPLFNLPGPNGGYPINIAYHAGATLDDEASWVGLGWNINVGSLVRSMRGLPDEFESSIVDEDGTDLNGNETTDDKDVVLGDYLHVKSDIKQAWTIGATGGTSLETLGADIEKLNFGLSMNQSVYYNNYTGIGASVGMGMEVGKKAAFGYGLSIDTENGAGVSASVSMGAEKNKNDVINEHKLSLNFDGSLSVDYSIARSESKNEDVEVMNGMGEKSTIEITRTGRGTFGSGISFARNNFTPSIANKLNSYSTSYVVKGGTEAVGLFFGWSAGLFYNTQDLDDEDIAGRKRPVIGYAQAGNTNDNRFTRDFIRSNDGQITKDSKFLAYSQYAYDVYNSTGQGLSGYFRARRSDIGRSFDPYVFNDAYGLSGGIDFGAGTTAKVGVDVSGKFGYTSSGPWDTNNDSPFDFENPNPSGIKENVYFQAHGEPTILDLNEMNHIGGFDLPTTRLQDKTSDGLGNGKRKIGTGSQSFTIDKIKERDVEDDERVVRNTLIHNLKNKEVNDLGEFKVKYFDNYANVVSDAPNTTLSRESRGAEGVSIENHPAGYKILNDQGSYYVYGLPAYNNTEIDNLFSVPSPDDAGEVRTLDYNTTGSGSNEEVDYKITSDPFANSHKFINKTTKSPYAHSHLLTSVLGADYVDIHNDGPTDDDLGYWVKFNYARYSEEYKWRAPYEDGMYHRGQVFTSEDDKVSYKYGEKEIWYLGQMETKSHIAVFKMSERSDMKEAGGEHGGTGTLHGLKIDEIRIYEKKAFIKDGESAVALQVVHFEYDYSLCQGALNSDDVNQGKLTLKKLYFTSNGSTRGERNKYEFNYGSTLLTNPDYEEGAYDSWGSYKPSESSVEHQTNFPYTNQFNQNWSSTAWEPNYSGDDVDDVSRGITKDTQDDLASAWCLNEIILPSGGKINIDYESDDYGYVQHKTANQMFKIEKMGDYPPGESYADNELHYEFTETNEYQQRRIYFKLEIPLDPNTPSIGKEIYDRYVEPLIVDGNGERNLYFKSKIKLTSQVSDYVSGYLPLEDYTENDYGVGSSVDGNGNSEYGFVTLKKARKRKKNNGQIVYFDSYHPMSLAAWIHLQTNASKLLHNPNSLQNEGNYDSPGALIAKLGDLMNIAPATASSFGAIRAYCKVKGMAKYIDLDESVIRLASPDKIKFGGGHRVKQISITDQWASMSESGSSNTRVYGQAYDYTIEEDGRTISSGVAQYEPQAGGDENALKHPIYYYAKQSVFTKNNLFAEAPLNEDMFPGASVGYRKVSVKSLHTNTQSENQKTLDTPGGVADAPIGRTGGVTVHEFYTSKDFPTMYEMSNLAEENYTKDVFNVPIPIPLVGSIKRNYFHGTQAYKIELNDMHGKVKSVKSFELNDYRVNDLSITSAFYEYQADAIEYQGEQVYKLNNEVSIIAESGEHMIDPTPRLMGVEYDLFTDQRESKTFNQSAGLEFNTDVIGTYTLPPVWPSFTNHKTIMRTYVSNKVIQRKGILKRTVSKDVQTSNESEIIAYDEKSGHPIVTKMTNEFGDEFFNYNIPAYYAYDRMGHAYRNINYNFGTVLTNHDPDDHLEDLTLFKFTPTQDQIDYLVRGDELLTSDVTSYQGSHAGNQYEYCHNLDDEIADIPSSNYDFVSTIQGVRHGCNVYDDVQLINGILWGYNADGDFVIIPDIAMPTVTPMQYDDLLPTPLNDYQKCYFLGWEYEEGGDNIVQGLIKFVEPLGSATPGVGGDIKLITDLKVIRSGRRNHHSTMAASYLTKGSINSSLLVDAYLGNDNNNNPFETKRIEADMLLSASASTFNDNWSENYSLSDEGTLLFAHTIDRDINPFISGNSGIFRPEKSYSYVGERSTSASMNDNSSSDPNLQSDGTFQHLVGMFQWDAGLMEDLAGDWEWVNEVTRYSNDSYEIENKNRLGIYSSALYGYDNSLTIAVGGNASYHELGVEDFETVSETEDWTSEERMKQNNLNFYTHPSANEYSIISETYSVKDATFNNGELYIDIDEPSTEVIDYFQSTVDYPSTSENTNRTFGISLTSERVFGSDEGIKSYFLNGSCTYANYAGGVLTIKIKPYLHCYDEPNDPLPVGLILNGKITTYVKKPMRNQGTLSSVDISSEKAHTGEKSMLVSASTTFDHPQLRTVKDKKYITSVWVSRVNDKVRTFEPSNGPELVVPGYMSGTTFVAFVGSKITYGKVIEGWQKIDLEFSSSDENAVVAFKFNPGTTSMYVDDFRYSPKTGGITTYVYDAEKLWLTASLNVDNYATLFFYDEEGNLTIKKQETAKGIFTITESRGHIADPLGNDPNANPPE